MKKQLITQNLTKNDSIIFDDKLNVWNENNYENVIVSKRFLDIFIVKNNKFTNNDFEDICYNKIKTISNFKSNECFSVKSCNILDENGIPLNIEMNEKCQKRQLDYLIPFFKIIFVLYHNFQIKVFDSIKLIRSCVFAKYKFDISFTFSTEKSDLVNMILTLGGSICDTDKTISATHIIINENKLLFLNKSLDNLKKIYYKAKFLKVKFVVDSFYFYSKMDEDDPDYVI